MEAVAFERKTWIDRGRRWHVKNERLCSVGGR